MERELLYQNPLARQLAQLPEFMEDINRNLGFVYLMESLPMKEIMDARRILITGCGDSYAAGIAVKPMLEEMLQMPVDVMRAVEFSRHLPSSCLEERPGSPLVVLISVSGTVTRILEAAQRANLHGANTLAITASRSTPLAKECRRVLELNPPEVERAPGCGAYVACCHALLALGIRMGRVRNSYVPAMEDVYRARAMEYIRQFTPEVQLPIARQMYELAQQWKDMASFDFVGDGCTFASALFSGWKFIEAAGSIVTFEDSENWLHENFFFLHPEAIGTILWADQASPSFSRQCETAAAMQKTGRPLLVITDAEPSLFGGAHVCRLPACEDWRYHPMMQHLPAVYLASYLAELKGTHYYREGDGDNWRPADGVYPIRRSEVVVL